MALGAEVSGARLAAADGSDIAGIKQLLDGHMVQFFPDQHMDADAHIAFGRHFGRLEGHPNLKDRTPEDHPELFRLAASEGASRTNGIPI